jgi:ribose transport system permease protein
MTFVIITGGIDLSVGSVISFVGIITTSMIKDFGQSLPLAIVFGLFIGIVIGFVNGILVSYIKMPAFITTMGMMTILRGLGYIYTKGYPIYDLPKEFKYIGQGYIGRIPVPTIILLGVAIIAYIVLRKTIFGRHIQAIGGNAEAAKIAGISDQRDVLIVYMMSGFISSIAAILMAARIGSGLPTIGIGYELDAIAAVVIGGAAMTGGTGTILGTILGSIILGVLSNGLSLLDVDSYVMNVISGLVVILAVFVDRMRTIMAQRNEIKRTRMNLNIEKGK